MGWPSRDSNPKSKRGKAVFRPTSLATAYEEALKRLGKRDKLRLRGVETLLHRIDVFEEDTNRYLGTEAVAVRYHQTDIVWYRKDGTILIRNGGFDFSPTTREKIETYVPGLRLWGQRINGDRKAKSCTHVAFGCPWIADSDGLFSKYALPLNDTRAHSEIIVWPDGGIGYEGETHAQVVARAVMTRLEAEERARNPKPTRTRRVHGALPGQLTLPGTRAA